MAYYDTPMSKLEAVNVALRGLGQEEAVSLEDNWPDVQQASKLIDDITRQLQIRGWHWNTDYGRVLSPNNDHEIILPNNTVSIDTSGPDRFLNAIQRGTKLYNADKGSFVFDRAVTLDIVLLFPFSDMPLPAKDYVAVSAAVQLQQNMLGADSVDKGLKERLQQAHITLRQDENRRADRNTITNNWSTYGIVRRSGFRGGGF